jgi:hypothetical protein
MAMLAGLLAVVAVPAKALTILELFESVYLRAPYSKSQSGVTPANEHVVGDWGGLRTRLQNDVIYLGLGGRMWAGANLARDADFEFTLPASSDPVMNVPSEHALLFGRNAIAPTDIVASATSS